MKRKPATKALHYGAGLKWTHKCHTITVGRNWPLCNTQHDPILRVRPEDVTCKRCIHFLKQAGLL